MCQAKPGGKRMSHYPLFFLFTAAATEAAALTITLFSCFLLFRGVFLHKLLLGCGLIKLLSPWALLTKGLVSCRQFPALASAATKSLNYVIVLPVGGGARHCYSTCSSG